MYFLIIRFWINLCKSRQRRWKLIISLLRDFSANDSYSPSGHTRLAGTGCHLTAGAAYVVYGSASDGWDLPNLVASCVRVISPAATTLRDHCGIPYGSTEYSLQILAVCGLLASPRPVLTHRVALKFCAAWVMRCLLDRYQRGRHPPESGSYAGPGRELVNRPIFFDQLLKASCS